MDLTSYPVKYIKPVQIEDGTFVQLRPIHPIDGTKAEEFRSTLSAESIYARFLGYIPRISEKLVKRLTEIDYSKEMAIIGEVSHEMEKEIIAVARIASDENKSAEFAIIISDDWHGKNLGSILTKYMIEIAEDMGFESIYALLFSRNLNMKKILEEEGFDFSPSDPGITIATKMFK